jgi:hypothetical protein
MKYTVFLSIVLILFFSCERNKPDLEMPDGKVVLSEKESYEIVSSPEYQQYMDIKYEFLDRVISLLDSGYTTSFLSGATITSMEEENHDLFYETFFDRPEQGEAYIFALKSAYANLMNTFPVLNMINPDNSSYMGEDDVSAFFKTVDSNRSGYSITKNTHLKNGEIVCGSYWQQVKLLACVGVCSASTAGAGAVVCGWSCWCMLCTENSAVADIIC